MPQPNTHITLALSQFFQNDVIGRAWMRPCEQESLQHDQPGTSGEVTVLAVTSRRAVAWVRAGLYGADAA